MKYLIAMLVSSVLFSWYSQPSYVANETTEPSYVMIKDRLHDLFGPPDKERIPLLIAMSSFYIDLLLLQMLFQIEKTRQYKYYGLLGAFYTLRLVIQQLVTLPLPPYYAFHNYLHVPSLYVKYDVLGDLFPSGHVAIPIFSYFVNSDSN